LTSDRVEKKFVGRSGAWSIANFWPFSSAEPTRCGLRVLRRFNQLFPIISKSYLSCLILPVVGNPYLRQVKERGVIADFA
jgi:hypothetical protein